MAAKKKVRKRTRRPITRREVTIIKQMTKKGATMRQIAKKIGRAPSVIWRWQHA